VPAGNALQQLSTVPVQTAPLVTDQNGRLTNALTRAWIQFQQALLQAILFVAALLPGISADAPVDTVTPKGWVAAIDETTGEKIFWPYYQ
jgi:hypothetical protein